MWSREAPTHLGWAEVTAGLLGDDVSMEPRKVSRGGPGEGGAPTESRSHPKVPTGSEHSRWWFQATAFG